MLYIVFFRRGLSLNLISTLYHVQKLKVMGVHPRFEHLSIYAQRTIG